MANPATQPTSRGTVHDYLLAAYDVDSDTVDTALASDVAIVELTNAVRNASHAYWPGDKIAAAHGWSERADYDIDAEGDDDDE